MKISVIGGGPAGLYFSLLLKKQVPAQEITVYERNAANDTFGWGVVFSDQTLENFRRADAETYEAITGNFAHWDDIDIHFKGRVVTSSGHGFSGIARKKLLKILQERAQALGVQLRFKSNVADDATLADSDLIVAADGINSAMRKKYTKEFEPDLEVRPAKFIWLGTTFPFHAFTFYFVENEHGVFQAHCYRFDENTSTFIVECDERSWRNAGFASMDAAQTVAACEKMFAQWLNGHPLLYNGSQQQAASPWINFVRVRNQHWSKDNIVLIGDAAHSAHFSIGSGTKLAMEDAISLAKSTGRLGVKSASRAELADALAAYEGERMTEALKLQNAARNSMEWFENVRRYVQLEPEQFAYSLLTRSQRVSHENLRLRDRKYLEGVERWFASRAESGAKQAIPPMFTPFTLRGMKVINRVAVSPMDMYSAVDGTPNDFHLVHYGARALGGAGLLFTEMTCVSPEARITLGCTGLYTTEHVEAWKRIVDFVHGNSEAKFCLQLGHSGRKGSIKLPWEADDDQPLDAGNWEVIGPSPSKHADQLHAPREMSRADMEKVLADFVHAATLGAEAGFDMLELHCAHGYLLSNFITPLGNQRTDEYGGSLENRLRYPLEVLRAVRKVWPAEKPISVRISATDWTPDGIGGAESVEISKAFHADGADIIHVSTGQTSPKAKPQYGRMYQTPYSDRIRNELGIPTIAVGAITEADQVNGIIAAGRADICALARPHLSDPHWTLHAAAELGYTAQPWPKQYLTGKQQLERLVQRAKQQAAGEKSE